MKKTIVIGTSLLLAVPAAHMPLSAQTVFRSTQSANLSTAAMLNQGNLLFEVSHRFDTPISQGSDALWGLDGPVINRLGLTYAPRDRLMLTVLRSNLDDNLELNAKFRVWVAGDGASVPIEVAGQGGIAWNTQPPVLPGVDDNEMQVYAQLIGNILLADRFALGVVPTFLRNPVLADVDPESVFVFGVNGQLYTEGAVSFLGEWIFGEARTGLGHDGGAFGIELRTRGHFFKLLVTNQSRMNPTQFLAGAPVDFGDTDAWRFGFNITRLLPF